MTCLIMYLIETKIFKSNEIILKVLTTNNSQSHFMQVFNIFLFQLSLNHYLIKIYYAMHTLSICLLRSTSVRTAADDDDESVARPKCVRSLQTDHYLGIFSSYKVTAVLVVD